MNKIEEIYIDDTLMDLSDVEPLSDDEYSEYWKKRKKEIDEEAKQK